MIIRKGNIYKKIEKPKLLDGLMCVLCGNRASEVHHILAGVYRKKSDEDGLTVPLCHQCHWEVHNKTKNYYKLKKIAQKFYEKNHTREEWIKRYGKNYL